MNMSNTHRTVTILDPERWGLKYGEKRQWFYKLRLDYFSDPLISGLKNDTKIVFLAILNESLRSNHATLNVCLEYLYGLLKVSLNDAKGCLNELEKNNIIELEVKVRTSLRKEKKRKEKKRKQTNFVDTVFDFESIYQDYPRKEGKANGMKKLQTKIKSQDDFDSFGQAVKNYKLLNRETDKKYIKQFSTFVNCYEDYINIDTSEALTVNEQAAQFLEKYLD